MQNRLYLISALFLAAVFMQWDRPPEALVAEVSVAQESSWLRPIFQGISRKLRSKGRHVFARGMLTTSEPPPPSARVETPKAQSALPPMNPKPGFTEKSERTLGDLSIRNLALGMDISEAMSLKGNGEVTDRLTTYWKGWESPPRALRFGATWLRYGSHYGSFDVEGICGAVYGDGLERSDVSILACGDTGEDVERVLGPPFYAAHTKYTRYEGVTWSYSLGNSKLAVQFRDGVVSRFILQENGFSDSGCY